VLEYRQQKHRLRSDVIDRRLITIDDDADETDDGDDWIMKLLENVDSDALVKV